MSRIDAKIGKSVFRTPVFTSGGCFGYVYNMERFSNIPGIGAVTPKSVTREPRKGAPPPRAWHGYGMHATGIALQNPGIDIYIKEKVPEIKRVCRPDQILVSVAGACIEDYVYNVERLLEAFGEDGFAAFEINAACPAVAAGGAAFSKAPKILAELIKAIRPIVKKNTLIIKIITMFDRYLESAKIVEDNGADAVHIVNTGPGTVIDVERKRPYFTNSSLNGPAMLPLGVMRTWDVYKTVGIPIIGSGGIYNLDGALQYFMAGASAIALGSAIFLDPMLPSNLPLELAAWLEEHCISHYSELIGAAHRT